MSVEYILTCSPPSIHSRLFQVASSLIFHLNSHSCFAVYMYNEFANMFRHSTSCRFFITSFFHRPPFVSFSIICPPSKQEKWACPDHFISNLLHRIISSVSLCLIRAWMWSLHHFVTCFFFSYWRDPCALLSQLSTTWLPTCLSPPHHWPEKRPLFSFVLAIDQIVKSPQNFCFQFCDKVLLFSRFFFYLKFSFESRVCWKAMKHLVRKTHLRATSDLYENDFRDRNKQVLE